MSVSQKPEAAMSVVICLRRPTILSQIVSNNSLNSVLYISSRNSY